jgi:Acyltransferase
MLFDHKAGILPGIALIWLRIIIFYMEGTPFSDRSLDKAIREMAFEEIRNLLHLRANSLWNRIMEWSIWKQAMRFSEMFSRLDHAIGEYGLQEGTRRCMGGFFRNVTTHIQQELPHEGPLLIISNHPGAADVLALASALPRKDIKFVAQDRPIIRAANNVNEHVILLNSPGQVRANAIMEMISYLKEGGALLLFPRGIWEPDPAIMPGARSHLASWSTSIGHFLSRVPETRLAPVFVSGVISRQAARSALVKLGKNWHQRSQVLSILSLIGQFSTFKDWLVSPDVHIGGSWLASEAVPSLQPELLTNAAISSVGDLMSSYGVTD